MRHLLFEESDQYPVAILLKESALRRTEVERHYALPLSQRGIPLSEQVAFSLDYAGKKKPSNKDMKAYLEELLPVLEDLNTHYLMVCDSSYFKILTKQVKAEPHYGYVLPCKIEGYEHMEVVLGLNHQALFYDPNQQSKLDLCINALTTKYLGTYTHLGEDIIQGAVYPDSVPEIENVLNQLHDYSELAADSETFSLDLFLAGIGTIAFGVDEHHGVAFACDYMPHADGQRASDGTYGYQIENGPVRQLLREFFESYQGTFKWHNATFDIRCIIYALWMEHDQDWEGMLKGLEAMMNHFHDTKIIAYLATNSTAGNELSLKDIAHEFAGNYAQEEITDIRKIPLSSLLEYNLVDTLATNYAFNKHYPVMVQDQQLEVYESLFRPSLKVIAQMELVGMPLEPSEVLRAKRTLEDEANRHLAVFELSPIIDRFEQWLRQEEQAKANAKLKTKVRPIEDFDHITFNPNSGNQLQVLLYDLMGLPVIDKTDTKQPATGAKTLEKLKNHTTDPDHLAIIEALIGYAKVAKILTAFIPNFENARVKGDGKAYLHGNFNLGGTVSGRLSSSKPNLQQIPSTSGHAKVIKKCFQAPKGWLFVGSDFASLEDRINALQTKDPNKLKVYTDGYDGHCLRAYAYFSDQMPDIDPNSVDSINSIDKLYKAIRQRSKNPTFALTYQGTWITLVRNLGFSEEQAKAIEKAYHELYRVSDAYVQKRIDQATRDGYLEVAFGLRVRTPLLAQTMLGHKTTPHEAEAEGRTAGNAMGQSYGLLNNRAVNEFMDKVWASEYKYDILPVAQIHDASYYLIRDDLNVVKFVNDHLCEAMRWQDDPVIWHDEVKLFGELDIYWPNWAEAVTLPNGASEDEIAEKCAAHIQELSA